MPTYSPDFTRFYDAISRRKLPDRLPLGEGAVAFEVMAAFLGRPISDLATYVRFWEEAGHDYTVLQLRGQWLSDSFQIKIDAGVLKHPNPAASASTYSAGAITDEQTFAAYPWIDMSGVYFNDVDNVEGLLPDGMKLIVNIGPLFGGIWRSMGLETFAIACIEQPDLVRAIADKTGQLLVDIAADVVQRDYVGAVWLGDDIAYTEGLMVRPGFYREYVFPYYAQIGRLCGTSDKLFIYHSDGRLLEVLDDLIDCGIQAINPNEPASVDIVQLKRDWGSKVSFIGNVDVDLLSRGTPQQVVEATRFLIDSVAPGGGFALASGNTVTDYVSLENYKAMIETVHEYGDIY